MTDFSKTKPKLIVLDLDGTALDTNNSMTFNLQNMLNTLIETKKCRVVLASGRSISSMKQFAHKLNLTAPVITLNGGVIIDHISDKIFYKKNLPGDIYLESIGILKKLQIDFVIFTPATIYAEKPSYITEILKEYTENTIKWTDNFSAINTPVKILFIPKSKDKVSTVKQNTAHLNIDIIDSGFDFVEIVPKGVNKGTALKIVSDMLNIEQKNIIAFGDNENDIEMLQFAGTGVAMGNAPDHVKAKADIIADTNDNDGVFKVLNQIFNSVGNETI